MNDHDHHRAMEREMRNCLHLRECENVQQMMIALVSLRNIYLEELRQSTEVISVGYAAVESALYKRQRLHKHQPSLGVHYLQIPQLLRLPANSFTCTFHLRYLYCQIPLLANSYFR